MCIASPALDLRLLARAIKILSLSLLVMFAAANTEAQITVHGTDAPQNESRAMQEDVPTKARVRRGELPPSKVYPYIEAGERTTRRLPPLTEEMIKRQSRSFMQGSTFAKRSPVGLVRDLPDAINRMSEATGFVVAEGKVLVLRVVAEEAKGLRLRFEDFSLPEGARLFVYSAKNRDEVHVFNGRGPAGNGDFWTPPVEGEAVVVEYIASENAEAQAALPFKIAQVSHIYADVWAENFNKLAVPCHRDVPEEWKSIARSVGLMQFVAEGRFEATCTGTLLNARNNDLTPYFLTANHCIDTDAEAQSVNIRWFYDSPGAARSGTFGASLLSNSATTDYSLLMLNGTLPPNLRWAGWTSVKPELSTSVTGIHHPAGDYKRFHTGTLVSSGCPSNLPVSCANLHTMRFTSGMGEPGTSGSGLWIGDPSDPLLIGQNFGGDATCSNPQGIAWYGRFDLTYPNIAGFLEGGSDDSFEENDSRATARVIGQVSADNLIVKATDEDWYRISLPAGAALNVKAAFVQRNGDIDLEMFRGDEAAPLVSSRTPLDFESVTTTNSNAAAVDYLVRVLVKDDTRNSYNLSVVIQNCTYSISSTTSSVSLADADRRVDVTTSSGCAWTASSNASWISVHPTNGIGSGSVLISVSYNYGATPQPRTGTVTIAGQTHTVMQEGCSYTFTPATRTFSQSGGTGRVDITLSNPACGSTWRAESNVDWITVVSTDSGYGLNGFIPRVVYSVAPNGTTSTRSGTLTIAGQPLTVTQVGADPQWQPVTLSREQVQFKYWIHNGKPQVYVRLAFPNTGFRVADWGQVIQLGGSPAAEVRVERFTGTSQPLQIETAHIYDLDNYPIIGQAFTLRFAGGTTLPFPMTTSWGVMPNPLDTSQQFVLEHYRDFLSREPDAPGLDFWTREITVCGTDAACIDRKRVNTSGAFFLSEEFQVTGYYVYRVYRGSLGRVPYYSEFTPDVGKMAAGIVVENRLSPEAINRNKREFAREFVERPEFLAIYGALSEEQYVDRLFQTTGVPPNAGERQSLIDELRGSGGTLVERRASVLWKVIDGIRSVAPTNGGVGVEQIFETLYGKKFYDLHFNRAFVLMQYFGYLKRDPDQEGYDFWLGKLNRFGNFHDAEMVRSFILAAEYRSRFGQP